MIKSTQTQFHFYLLKTKYHTLAMFCASLEISTQTVCLQRACKEEMVLIHFIIPEYFSKAFLENKLIAFH